MLQTSCVGVLADNAITVGETLSVGSYFFYKTLLFFYHWLRWRRH